MTIEAISIGPATTLVADQVYALPAKLCFLTSTLEVETSVDGLIWTALTGSDTTGAIAPGVFVRCSSDVTVVLRDAVGIYSSSGSSSNPFDQDLNTTDPVEFLSVSTPLLTRDSGDLTISTTTSGILSLTGIDGIAITGTLINPLNLGDENQINFESGTSIVGTAFDHSLTLQASGPIVLAGSAIDLNGPVNAITVSAVSGFLIGATPGIDATITTGSLVGKTITIEKGIITGFA